MQGLKPLSDFVWCRASRTLQQPGICADLVPGGYETPAEVAAGDTLTVVSYDSVGPIYVVASPRVRMFM